MRISNLWLLVLVALLVSCTEEKKPWLSQLSAGKDFPIYTTYAAAQGRSDYLLDQGYEFRYDREQFGADFITDTGGDIAFGFRRNGQWVYKVSEMAVAPVITASYPDMVSWVFQPFGDVRVKARFFTYSSRSAMVDFEITNVGKEKIDLEIFPFMRSNQRRYHSFENHGDQGWMAFSHEEYPDGWTLAHDLPYTDSIRNVLLLSVQPDATASFNSENGESPLVPSGIILDRQPVRQLTGRLYNEAGERLTGGSPVNRIHLKVNGQENILITENSPVFGSTQPTFEMNGYFRTEAGNLDSNARTYRMTGYNENLGAQGTVTGDFSGTSARKDMVLNDSEMPLVNEITFTEGQLTWGSAPNAESYSVYRRKYPDAVYVRVAEKISEPLFRDPESADGVTYGYVVTCHFKGRESIHSREAMNVPVISFDDYLTTGNRQTDPVGNVRVVAFQKGLSLAAGKSERIRLVRSVFPVKESLDTNLDEARKLLSMDIQPFEDENMALLNQVKTFSFADEKQTALYWSNVNMMRQQFYPPQAKSDYNYYVFSREPIWGWGHGGQVFHESIVMLAYASVNPEEAMNSQRVYSQRQYPNGYINYRTGSYLDEIIEHNGELTSSAPWYSWLNWEVYKMTGDKAFLREMYDSSVKFYEFYVSHRDKDNDGLCEWGGHAVLESVRDALVAVWDEVAWPANFEALDLNCMMVMEAKSLEAMALELGLQHEASRWKADHENRAALINQLCWDPETSFYYHVDKENHTFTHKTDNDLKRMEIIGFLPLWAGIASKEQAEALVGHLTNPDKFWRKYGIPSLSADDSYYNDKGYWNGPVWVQWNYLIQRGLADYGYHGEATELVRRVSDVMHDRLSKDHNLWEFYSPDELWGGHHKTYIWAGIVNRMMEDVASYNP